MDAAFGTRRRHRRPIINITPLIDVMFLLLIFFMVSSTFREHLGIDITLPRAATGSEQAEDGHEITVKTSGDIFIGQRLVSVEELRESLTALVAEEPEAVITLRADEAAAFQRVVTVIDTVRGVGGMRLVIPTHPLLDEAPPQGP